MRHLILLLGLLLPCLSFAQDEIEYKQYSYSEFMNMILEEKDSIFSMEYTQIIYNPQTDKRFRFDADSLDHERIIIDKAIYLNYVSFQMASPYAQSGVGLSKIEFNKSVTFHNTQSLAINKSIFNGPFNYTGEPFSDHTPLLEFNSKLLNWMVLFLSENEFHDRVEIRKNNDTADILMMSVRNNEFHFVEPTMKEKDETLVIFPINGSLELRDNKFFGNHKANILARNAETVTIRNNEINLSQLELKIDDNEKKLVDLEILDNKINVPTFFRLDNFSTKYKIDWAQFEKGIYSKEAYLYVNQLYGYNKSFEDYQNEGLYYKNENAFNEELKLKSQFYSYYKNAFITKSANSVYVDIKDVETLRMAYDYEQDQSFKNFFTWKINQFLKTFSAYGTEPARAVIYSVYVILAFALVYLFFPNYWDSHGKNRIMDRYRFFLKYVNKDSGMHEVYLDEKQPDLLASEDFRHYLQEQGKTAPKFFMATALPLYRWSVAGTKTFSWMLSKVDVLKGKWSDTEDSKKGGKSILLIGAFLIALLYDIFIKILNALMLSINTFTTLGFGEIPIKGLPRYLAIIQGFIGWFMLTIFSVSLISQLLN